jgi:hypothetical protein
MRIVHNEHCTSVPALRTHTLRLDAMFVRGKLHFTCHLLGQQWPILGLQPMLQFRCS